MIKNQEHEECIRTWCRMVGWTHSWAGWLARAPGLEHWCSPEVQLTTQGTSLGPRADTTKSNLPVPRVHVWWDTRPQVCTSTYVFVKDVSPVRLTSKDKQPLRARDGKPRAGARAFAAADSAPAAPWECHGCPRPPQTLSEKHSWQCSLSYLFIFQNKNNKHMTMISREHLGSLPPSHSFQQFLSHYHSWMCTWLFILINRKELEQRQVYSVILVSLAQCTLRSRWSINIHFYELNWIVTNSDKESKRRPTASGLKRWYTGRNVSQVLGSKRFIQKLIL